MFSTFEKAIPPAGCTLLYETNAGNGTTFSYLVHPPPCQKNIRPAIQPTIGQPNTRQPSRNSSIKNNRFPPQASGTPYCPLYTYAPKISQISISSQKMKPIVMSASITVPQPKPQQARYRYLQTQPASTSPASARRRTSHVLQNRPAKRQPVS